MSDELTSDLRELAAEGETPPTLTGAQIRGRAVRRRRRRRTALAAAGASVAGALALVVALSLGGDTDRELPPAASPTVTASSPATPDATVDLGRRVLSVAGRQLPITAGTVKTPTPTGRMTVLAKKAVDVLTARDVGFSDTYDLKAPWVIQLGASDGSENFIATMTYDEKALGNYDRTGGWIGLRQADAKWLYEQLSPGAVIDIEASGAADRTPSPTPTGVDGRGVATAGSTGMDGGAATAGTGTGPGTSGG
ncbi:L,D-transpeptidase [Streptomyces sp. NPDC002688]|uniref:L,D-transpeptidase n=1 Tax=Streptomyces sp. NPDC002688 TaxID=3154423 RepID=UPI003326173E